MATGNVYLIDLNQRRKKPLDMVQIQLKELADVDLSTIAAYDWLEGIGTIHDFAVIGFLQQCARAGIRLIPAKENEHGR